MSHTPAIPAPVDIVCQDGTCLKGHVFSSVQNALSETQVPVLICPATGVKQHFYFSFARWLAEHGHEVLVFDYRGIGLSLQGALKNSRATLAEWGQQDQAAAIDWLVRHTGQDKVLLMGHSAGGQMLGLLPNYHRVERAVGVASSTGWLKRMRPAFRLKATFGLRVFLPLGIRFKGYGPCKTIGLGENLPAKVALQWGEWCSQGGYATQAVKRTPHLDFHAQIRIPYTVLHATDDDIATPGTVSDLLRTLPKAQKQVRCIAPKSMGLMSIGHMDWFRPSHQVLWPMMAEALTGHSMHTIPMREGG